MVCTGAEEIVFTDPICQLLHTSQVRHVLEAEICTSNYFKVKIAQMKIRIVPERMSDKLLNDF